jgi:hypothetical protein
MAEWDWVQWIAMFGLALYGLAFCGWFGLAIKCGLKGRMLPRETAATVLCRHIGEAFLFLALSGRVFGWW